jgi:hypothetical protein
MKLLSLLAAPLLVLPVSAQQEVRFRALSFTPDFPVELHAHEASGSQTVGLIEIKSFLNHEATSGKCDSSRIVFTRRSNPVSATRVDEVLGSVELPAEMKSCILLFLPEPKPAVEFQSRVIAIDDSSAAFPAGSFRLSNLSQFPVRLELGDDKLAIAPGETKTISDLSYGDNQSVSMRAFVQKNDEWTLIAGGVWTNPGSKRVLQIISEDPASGVVGLRGVRDIAESP